MGSQHLDVVNLGGVMTLDELNNTELRRLIVHACREGTVGLRLQDCEDCRAIARVLADYTPTEEELRERHKQCGKWCKAGETK